MFKPTVEQQQILEVVTNNQISKANACSGSGKTSTLCYVSGNLVVPSLYMAFNKSMADEASNKFPDHVTCMTTHSLAYRAVGYQYAQKLSRPQGQYVNVLGTGTEVARAYRIKDLAVEDKKITANYLGLIIKDTVNRFETSVEEDLDSSHIPVFHLKDIKKRFGKSAQKQVVRLVTPLAVRLWKERTDVSSTVLATHNTYLKLYQLTNPDLSHYEVIYLDESQDLNPVTLDIILKQNTKVVFVGDSYQQIYGFNNAINAMDKVNGASSSLTKSFRYGQEIADIATLILNRAMVITGNENVNSTVGKVDRTKPYTILFRSNINLVGEAVELISQGKTVNINIDVRDFVNMLDSCVALCQGNLSKVKHEQIVPFEKFADLVEEAKNEQTLARFVNIIEGNRHFKVLKMLRSYKNNGKGQITLSTAHKSKGLEYSQVILANDFPSNYDKKGHFVGLEEAERNLLYVAATRAIDVLEVNDTVVELQEFQSGLKGSVSVQHISSVDYNMQDEDEDYVVTLGGDESDFEDVHSSMSKFLRREFNEVNKIIK